jgi:murein DD-endopeptidase MepM/ murein hydrolase activator NlpD
VVLSFCYCPHAQPERRDAIDIVVPDGGAVRAVANGIVSYAGNDLKEYRGLILISHCDGWVTAYAGTGPSLIRRGERVTRGQTVAIFHRATGIGPGVLHFEMRKANKIVAPLDYLPEKPR